MDWKKYLPEFREKTEAFYAGQMNKAEYKGISGFYGSYAQRNQNMSMLRLRMPAGRVTKEKLAFVADMIRKYQIDCVHFTTGQTIQLHNLDKESVADILEKALDVGIVTIGSGGDYPRNVTCSPLSGVEEDEYFDVLPWAEAAAEYLMGFILKKKMPRKLKVGFSNSPRNISHATYRDLGFAATPEGKFDVYSAGGLGRDARMGVKVAENIDPEKILCYIQAMWLTFCTYGNYENRNRARSRYMQEALGGPEEYRRAYQEKLREVMMSGGNSDLQVKQRKILKTGNGSRISGKRVFAQKQTGLYTVIWHPLGGIPRPEVVCNLSDILGDMDEAELRLAPDETAYIINLTGKEAQEVLKVTADCAESLFETSVSCIGAQICQIGLRDSQGLLRSCIEAVKSAGIPDRALPQMHISGCPSSCGTHQTGRIGFRGSFLLIDKMPQPAYVLYVNGCELQGREQFGREVGTMLETDIPDFLVELGKAVAESGMDFEKWMEQDPERIDFFAKKYLQNFIN